MKIYWGEHSNTQVNVLMFDVLDDMQITIYHKDGTTFYTLFDYLVLKES